MSNPHVEQTRVPIPVAELARCKKCGHYQAEPNWCHECGHRVEFPEWWTKLEAEREQEIREISDVLTETTTALAYEGEVGVVEDFENALSDLQRIAK